MPESKERGLYFRVKEQNRYLRCSSVFLRCDLPVLEPECFAAGMAGVGRLHSTRHRVDLLVPTCPRNLGAAQSRPSLWLVPAGRSSGRGGGCAARPANVAMASHEEVRFGFAFWSSARRLLWVVVRQLMELPFVFPPSVIGQCKSSHEVP